jgi:hypothetical protein
MKAILILLLASMLVGCSVTKQVFSRTKSKTEHAEADTSKLLSAEHKSSTDTSKNKTVVTLVDTTKTVTIDETITEYTVNGEGKPIPTKTTTRKTQTNTKGESSITSQITVMGQSETEIKLSAAQKGISIRDESTGTDANKQKERTSYVWFGISVLLLAAVYFFLKSQGISTIQLISKLWKRLKSI